MGAHVDVLVIGGGIAGVAAALDAAAGGARVAVVRAGPGATAMASGRWRGPLPARLGEALAAAGLGHVPVSAPLPHPHGTLRPADFAPESHAAAVIGPDTCVCGIAGLPGFPAAALARMWGAPRHAVLRLAGTPAAGWSPVALAAHLERDPTPLAVELRRLGGGGRAVLPAVLGLDPATRTRERLLSAAGVEVGEALAVPPSVPGWRLDRALLEALSRAGVELINGRVVGRQVDGVRVVAVTVETGGSSPVAIAAAEFVLATGRFVGGGITAADETKGVDVARGQALREAELVERALGCEVWVEHLGDRFTQVQPVPLTDAVRREPQALLGAGVHVDEFGHPLDAQDRVTYANVVARGAVVAETTHGLGFAAAPEAIA